MLDLSSQTDNLEPEKHPALADEPLHELTNFIARIGLLLESRGYMGHPEERAVLKLWRYKLGDAPLEVWHVPIQDGAVAQATDVEFELMMHDLETRNRE